MLRVKHPWWVGRNSNSCRRTKSSAIYEEQTNLRLIVLVRMASRTLHDQRFSSRRTYNPLVCRLVFNTNTFFLWRRHPGDPGGDPWTCYLGRDWDLTSFRHQYDKYSQTAVAIQTTRTLTTLYSYIFAHHRARRPFDGGLIGRGPINPSTRAIRRGLKWGCHTNHSSVSTGGQNRTMPYPQDKVVI